MMLSYDEARLTILEHTKQLPIQRLKLAKMAETFLAAPLIAQYDMPLFDNSAVDGFGVAISDIAKHETPVRLRLSGVIRAGDKGNIKLNKNEAFKILTGAPVPKSVEAIIMQEFCKEEDGYVYLNRKPEAGDNIRRRGEEFRKGCEILPAGTPVTPAVIGLVATFGHSSFKVYRKPKVALISTGSELIQPGKPLAKGQIYNSNTYSLALALQKMGIDSFKSYQVKDSFLDCKRVFSLALKESDVVIPIGGVSVGDYDLVREVLTELGVMQIFWKIPMKPGKPVYFGKHETKNSKRAKLVFGLPGNPVSALITFHQLVQPSLLKLIGQPEPASFKMEAILTKELRKKAGRIEFVRGYASMEHHKFTVKPTLGQDSHMLGGLAKANCLIHFPADKEYLVQGETVTIEMLKWSL